MAEIQRSPVEIGSLSHYLQGFKQTSQVVGLGISEPSTVSPKSGFSQQTMHR